MIASGTIIDLRRKIEPDDYQKIRLFDYMNYTRREIATEFGISTKYVKKILNGEVGHETPPLTLLEVRHYSCSGCNRTFSYSGIGEHFAIWTSGNNPLSCIITVAGLN